MESILAVGQKIKAGRLTDGDVEQRHYRLKRTDRAVSAAAAQPPIDLVGCRVEIPID